MMAAMQDYNERLRRKARTRAMRIRSLREKGIPWASICDLEGCTRQRLWALLKRFDMAPKRS